MLITVKLFNYTQCQMKRNFVCCGGVTLALSIAGNCSNAMVGGVLFFAFFVKDGKQTHNVDKDHSHVDRMVVSANESPLPSPKSLEPLWSSNFLDPPVWKSSSENSSDPERHISVSLYLQQCVI